MPLKKGILYKIRFLLVQVKAWVYYEPVYLKRKLTYSTIFLLENCTLSIKKQFKNIP